MITNTYKAEIPSQTLPSRESLPGRSTRGLCLFFSLTRRGGHGLQGDGEENCFLRVPRFCDRVFLVVGMDARPCWEVMKMAGMGKKWWRLAIIREYMRSQGHECTCGAEEAGADYHRHTVPWFIYAGDAFDVHVAEARELGKKPLI